MWREFESGDGFGSRALRIAILAGGLLFLCFTAVLHLTWEQQGLLALLMLGIAVCIDRGSKSYVATLTMILLSVFATFRYGFWRVSTAIAFFRDPGARWTALDGFFIGLLLLAEGYAFVVLLLGYLQMLWPLRRKPAPLPDDTEEWPAVDLLIPTRNEPLSVVRHTALAAMNIDWPTDRLNVYLLDDGRREEFRKFAEESGIGYISRDDNEHAKAGNINHALQRLNSPLVAVFDCDQAPTRSFLQVTVGWLLRDPRLALVQTPHHFYSPDPFERNLDQFRMIPGEDELFYGVVQDGNDFWNAAFFCGSCAVLRRSALDEVGGVAVETVTEDAHTSLRMQMRGWNTAYINIPQAAGLATERLSGYVRQRIRWARGMVQILRIENPLFAKGLKPAQRLCYFNAMAHFLYALPRLIFLTAPLGYLIFGMTTIPGYWAAIVAYAAPHLVLSNLTNSRIQGPHRHSFWNEIYETVLAPYTLLPTLLALINPRAGSFNVTAKGGTVDENYFDARIARPYLALLALNLFGLFCAAARLWQFPIPTLHLAWPLLARAATWLASLHAAAHPGMVWVNVVWTLFNVMLLGIATSAARESQQQRQSVRVPVEVPSDVVLADRSIIQGITCDLSSGGVRTKMDQVVKAEVGDPINFVLPVLDGTATLPATIISIDGSELRAQFDRLTLQEDEALTMILYSRADAWLGWGEAKEADDPMRSMRRIVKLSMRSLSQSMGGPRGRKRKPKGRLVTRVTPLLLLALLAGGAGRETRAQAPAAGETAGAPAVGTFDHVFTLADAGLPETLVLRGVEASHSIRFWVPRTEVVRTATMKLRYHFSPGLLPGNSQLNVSLNGTLFATLTPAQSDGQSALLEATLSVPADLLKHDNQLSFEFVGHYAPQCEDPSNSTLWSRVDADSTIELAGSLLPLANDLKQLPLPFYDQGVDARPVVPIVFLAPPSAKAMQAAGVVASWFGVLNGDRAVRFPVSIGTIPAGSAVLIAEDARLLPASLEISATSGATVAMRDNPSDASGKLLVVTGGNADEMLTATMALALHGETWEGPQVSIQELTLPPARKPDDAPRWLSTEKDEAAKIGQIAQTTDLQGDGSTPLSVTLRLPPDLNFGDTQGLNFGETKNLAFHMSYRYNGIPLGNGSSLQVYVNGAYVSSTPMPHLDKASPVLETVVPIPVSDLRPFTNTITFRFAFQPAKRGQCEDGVPPNLEGAILKDSYLDIAGIPHWTMLPNLELFANAGYPFTRKADLADTVVVLPDQPSTDELEMFLSMMGHFGAQTGSPALQVTVTDAAGMTSDGSKDYLVLGTVGDQPALKTLSASLPVGVDEGGLHVHDSEGLLDRAAWWRGRSSRPAGQLDTAGGLPDALIEGVEWPGGSGRSVVVIALRDQTAIPDFVSAFLKARESRGIGQSVSLLHGAEFSSYPIGNRVYRVGETAWLTRLMVLFEEFPWLVAMVTVIFCYLMAVLLQAELRRRARMRLQGEG
jgi:cellulose synthase (UDP-forming)